MSSTRLAAIVAAAVLLPATVVSAAGGAGNAFPGANGRIVFETGHSEPYSHEVVLANADGTGVVNLTRNSNYDGNPQFSPEGNRIVFESARSADRRGDIDIFTMRTDASELTQLTFSVGFDADPTWSPDGTKIAFESNRADSNYEI